MTNGARFFQNPQIVADRARRGEVSEGLVNFGGTGPSAVIGAHSFYVEARSAGGRGSRTTAATSTPRGSSSAAAWQAAGGAIFVGDNRADASRDMAADAAAPEAGQGSLQATKVTDPGRSIFVVGPGLAAGAER